MNRFSLLAAGLTAATMALIPAAASAQIVELGKTPSPVSAPVCPSGVAPSQCYIILTRTTAIQTISDGIKYPITAKQDGWIVSFTVGLSKLSSSATTERKFLHTLNAAYGGEPELALAVLKPTPHNYYTVAAQSQIFRVTPFLGQVLQQPMALPPTFTQFTALPIKAGDVIALTVPTWAPVLSYNLSTTKFAYRQSRAANCTRAAGSQTAQLTVGAKPTQYKCNYLGTRVEYSATEVVDTPPPKNYVH
ncbi:MAG TPA: hypothetical protein VF781_13210 [Solirubrobacteraceae bacterium]